MGEELPELDMIRIRGSLFLLFLFVISFRSSFMIRSIISLGVLYD